MPLSASVFRRGGPKKELFDVINEDVDDEVELNAKLAELDELLHTDKVGRELSAALYRPHLHAAELVKHRKQCARDVGFLRGRRQYLHIEEAVYLLDRGDLLLFIEELEQQEGQQRGTGQQPLAQGPPKLRQRLLSVQEAYDLMISMGVSMERYMLYGSLNRSGYLVMRHPSRWLLERNEQPEQVWGDGAWAQCYGRQPSVPGAAPRQAVVMHQQLQQVASLTTSIGADAAAPVPSAVSTPPPAAATPPAPAASPEAGAGEAGAAMEVDATAAAAAVAAAASTLGQRSAVLPSEDAPQDAGPADGGGDAGSGGAGGGLGGGSSQRWSQQHRRGAAATAAAAATTAAVGLGGARGAAGPSSRGWWLAAGPRHPHLAGIPQTFFEEMPPAPVEERLSTSLLARFPNLRPFRTVGSALAEAAVPLPPQATSQGPQQDGAFDRGGGRTCAAASAPLPGPAMQPQANAPAAPEVGPVTATGASSTKTGGSSISGVKDGGGAGGGDGGAVDEGGGVWLGEPRISAHLVYDVYKPGSFVSRYKGQFPAVQTHVAVCSATPPTLAEMRAADAAAEAARVGEGGKPAVVTWAATLNGDLALYSIGQADMLRLL